LASCSSGPETSVDAAPPGPSLIALRWLPEDADRVAVLTTLPPACEARAPSVEEKRRRDLGRIAFESPALLGGAAARMGLSCSSCHLNGRGNPAFFIEGVSDKPGMADVTSSIFSKVRGDQSFNPVVIPDIGLRDGKQIKDRLGPEFHTKVRGLIVEEFDGQEPPAPVFDAVLAYLDGLEPAACAAPQSATPLWRLDLDAAKSAYSAGVSPGLDDPTRLFYLRAARARLERIHERYPDGEDANLRRDIITLSRGMGELSDAIRRGSSSGFYEPDWTGLNGRLEAAFPRSLYKPEVLRAALATGQKPAP
jgi:hypothetical protein